MGFPELSTHVIAAMFLATLLVVAQGHQREEIQSLEEEASEYSHRKFPRGIELAILKQLLPRLIADVLLNEAHTWVRELNGQQQATDQHTRSRSNEETNLWDSLRNMQDTTGSDVIRPETRHPRLFRRYDPIREQRVPIVSDKLGERRKRTKLTRNTLAALFSDLRNSGSKDSLIMPSLRIG